MFCGSLFCCLNYDTQAVELYNGSTLLGSYSQEIARTASADLRDNPSMYTVEMRIRGNRVRVYSGSSYTLRFTATASGFPADTPGTARTATRSVNCSGWETPGPTSRMSGLMWRCRMAASKLRQDQPFQLHLG